MNHHEFVNEMALIHASVRRVEALIKELHKIEQEMSAIKSKIESYVILPDEILNKKEG